MRISRFTVAIASSTLVLGLVSLPGAQAISPAKGAPQTINGSGDSVPAFSPIDEPIIVTLTHDGASNFIVSPVGKDGDEGMSWANEIGPYTGTIFQEMNDLFSPYNSKNPIIAATVMADGNWSMQVQKLSAAPRKSAKNGNGAGDQVIQFPKASKGFKRIAFSHDGTSNFIVIPIDAKGKSGVSLVNEIGNYKGTVALPSGTKYLWVKADGNWNYSVR